MNNKVFAVIGAGGKTTWIKREALRYRELGMKVLVCTTTHMLASDCTLMEPDIDAIRYQLEHDGYCMTGEIRPDGRKMSPLLDEVYKAACQAADIVLVEADGAKHFSIKYPAAHEPVIPENVTDIVLVMGCCNLGKPARDNVFRYEILKENLSYDDNSIVTMEMIDDIIEVGYGPVFATNPDAKRHIFISEFVQNELIFHER